MITKRSYTGAGSYVIPLNHYGNNGYSFYATASITVKPLADKDNQSSLIDATGTTGTGGTVSDVHADAVLVTTTGAADVIVIQYGD